MVLLSNDETRLIRQAQQLLCFAQRNTERLVKMTWIPASKMFWQLHNDESVGVTTQTASILSSRFDSAAAIDR